ncbi:aminopeptidase [Candidatus Woesearchaeota archaeon]|nr:aminopeptidase [Candidatus Woesearchaeota archaeon]
MDTVESLVWLKRKRLFEKCKLYAKRVEIVFTESLQATDTDVLIIGDRGTAGYEVAPVFAGACFLASRSLNINSKLVLQEPKTKGGMADLDVRQALEKIRPGSAVVLSLSGRIGGLYSSGKNFRRLAKERRLRFTSTPSLGTLKTSYLNRLVDAINIDYRGLQYTHQRLKKLLDYGNTVHIRTSAGTDLQIGIKGCTAITSDGFYTEEGEGGNLPAGEVFIAPAKKQVEGKVVVDGSSRNKDTTVLVKKPFTIYIERGEVTRIEGGKEAKVLQDSIDWAMKYAKYDWGIKRIGELGIGLNPRAQISGAMIVDEKVRGTAHVAIGSNYWFGGGVYAMIHLDQVFKNPKITIDGRVVSV